MFDTLLADGIVSGAGERVAAFAVKCLAVAGAFLVGYLLGGAIAWALDRWAFAKKAPDPLKKTVAVASAVALALLVALVVFGDGGSGLFGGGGGDGKGTPSQTDDKGKAPAPEPKKIEAPPKKDETPKAPPKPTPGDVRVTILAGEDVKEGKFYVLEGEAAPKTFEELKTAVAARRAGAEHDLTLIFRFRGASLSPTHPDMQRLTAWLKEAKLLNRFE